MDTKRVELVAAIEQQMEQAIDLFYQEISTAFQPLTDFCATERKRYEPLLQRVDALKETFSVLRNRIGASG